MSVSPPLWRWAVEDDEPQMGTEEALIRQLASGRLPPYALVWREGWGEWLPAMQVEELAEAFPEVGVVGTRTARPSSIPGIPPVPVSEYPRLRHLAKAAPLGWPDGFEYRDQDVITSEVPAVVMKEAARVMTQPTPPADLGLHAAIERHSRRPDELTPFFPPEYDEVTPVSQRVRSVPPEPAPASERAPASGPARPLAAEYGLEGLIDEAPARKNWPLWWRSNGLWVALLVIALGVAGTFALRHFGVARGVSLASAVSARLLPSGGSEPPATPAPVPAAGGTDVAQAAEAAAVVVAPSPAPVAPPTCQFRQPPLVLDDWAVVDVRPLLRELPAAGGALASVAVGYAESHRSASGGTLDVASLRLARQFSQQEDRQIFSVTPLARGGRLSFHVERQGSNVAFGRALDMDPPVRVGMNDDGLVGGQLDQRSQRLWPLPIGAMMSVPEVGEHARGLVLASRAGRSFGHVRLGLLDTAGQPRSALAELGEEGTDYGRPGLATGADQTVVAVARRADARHPGALFLARAPNGRLPTELVPFPLPPLAAEAPPPPSAGSRPDPELLAPVLAPLPGGRFALMWSQGEPGWRQVRLQVLSDTLEPLGAPFDVTPADPALGAATAAALHWASDRLLAFYFVRRDDGHSLWVGSLACG